MATFILIKDDDVLGIVHSIGDYGIHFPWLGFRS